jgi:hypothetical protein
LSGKEIVPPLFSEADSRGIVNGVLACVIDEKWSYVDSKGKIVWQEKDRSEQSLKTLNLDCLNRASFYAYSKVDNENDIRSGGWSISDNFPKKVEMSEGIVSGKLQLIVDTTRKSIFENEYTGFSVFVINTTDSTMVFEAQDSRLNMKIQAKTKQGIWKDIEYLPNSWCGNSYHNLELPSGYYWSFIAPKHEGALETVMRISLEYAVSYNLVDNRSYELTIGTLYSNEFLGSVNNGQFWRKNLYRPKGIMYPYFD